jgi:prepilin-type N-terminal cleavage/methylation domain-containing protein
VCSDERGFSLLEVMTVVVIIGITAAIAVPNYLVWNRTYQLRQATTDLHGNLALARMMAMNQNAAVNIAVGAIACPPNTTSCGINGVSFTQQLNGTTVVVIPPIPLASRNITAALTTGGTTVQLNSLGLRIGGPIPPGDPNQYITLTNTDNLIYSIVITPVGKIRWCPASTCS